MKQIGDVIAQKRKNAGMSQSVLAERLLKYDIRVKNAAISSWEKNNNTPTAYQLLAVCEILGIKDIYSEFIGDNDFIILDGLNETGRQRVKEYIELLKSSDRFNDAKSMNNIIEFRRKMPVAVLSASAGIGEMLDYELFEEQEFEHVPDRAEFGVRLNGDSMEPTFHDCEIAWFRRDNKIPIGEIGLFYLNRMTYCKRFAFIENDAFLISDNKKYDPILISEESEFKVLGVAVYEEG